MYNYFLNTLPTPLTTLFTTNETLHTHDTRNRQNTHVAQRRISITSKSLRHKGPEIWYSIPKEIISMKTIKSFSNKLKKILQNNY